MLYEVITTMGGDGSDVGRSVVVDSSNNFVYITGSFSGTNVDFDYGTGAGEEDFHTSVNEDIFVTKINSDGTYGWTRTMGGDGSDISYNFV